MLRTAAALIVVLGVSRTASAGASDVELLWSAPQSCPGRAQLQQSLSRRVGRELAVGADAALVVDGRIVVHEQGYELSLHTQSPAGTEQRTLRAKSCAELAQASVLIAALLISPEPELTAAPALKLARPEGNPRAWRVGLRVRAVGDLGSLAAVRVGPGVGVGIVWGATHMELGALLLPTQATHLAGPPATQTELQLMAASAGLCRELLHHWTLAPCAYVEAGRLLARGPQLATPGAVGSPWLVTALALRAGLRLFEAVYVHAEGSLGVPWLRPRFAVHGAGVVHDVPVLIGRLELSLE
ncbi:MAG: hypothetical protein RL701_2980, partial [Pseudomonadota bacterium]